ncbi:MAG: gliding motility-associated C-terminal domain-containing protein [Bacteroidales bacterium]|jgi:gliding motility-associated-like protein|nr:gliding motility-associated C-terminal domain-containing protein [Bacteroidales bacterium]
MYSQTTEGKDFWLTFGGNGGTQTTIDSISLQIRIVTAEATNVTFTFTQTGTTFSLNLPAHQVYTRNLSLAEKQQVYANTTGKSARSLHVQASAIISLYASNLSVYTSDATSVLPVEALGKQYYQLSYSAEDDLNDNSHDGYQVIATQDNTRVHENGTLLATLNKGEVYSRYFALLEDGTGNYVTADKPVAFFVTNECAYIPQSFVACDCLFEQMFPLKMWGKTFMVPATRRGMDRIRVIASRDNTSVQITTGYTFVAYPNNYFSYDPVTSPVTLNAGEFVEFDAVRYLWGNVVNEPGCFIQADKPVAVASYLLAIDYWLLDYQIDALNWLGDPSIAWIPPVEQFVNEITIAPFIEKETSVISKHNILVVTETAFRDSTFIKVGNGIDSLIAYNDSVWFAHPSGYSFIDLSLDTTDVGYTFKNSHGLMVMGYGIGNSESYYYMAGAAAASLNAWFTMTATQDSYEHCEQTFEIQADIGYELSPDAGHLKWLLDGVEQVAARDSNQWQIYLSPGTYQISMITTDYYEEIDTINQIFIVYPAYEIPVYENLCAGDTLYYNDTILSPKIPATYTYTFSLLSSHGCDSIITLYLTVHPPVAHVIYKTIPKGTSYYFNEQYLTEEGLYFDTLLTSMGCDSLLQLNLSIDANNYYHPISLVYAACPGQAITMGFTSMSNVQYYWYTDSVGGTVVAGGSNRETLTITKNSTADIGTWWVEARYAGNNYPRYKVTLQAAVCGAITPTGCAAMSENVLFKEDFGGNATTDPPVKPYGISQTTYTYNSNPTCHGCYRIAKQGASNGSHWYTNVYDHTNPGVSNKGYMIQFDASDTKGTFYAQTISSLCSGTELYFSVWLQSVDVSVCSNPANCIFVLRENNASGRVLAQYYTGNIPDAQNWWKTYGFYFTIPQGVSTIYMEIINNGTGSDGNDFVMDDIEVRICTPPVVINNLSGTKVCSGTSANITTQFANDGTLTEPIEYQWFKSNTGNDGTWNMMSGQSRDTLTFYNFAATDVGYYRLAVAGAGSINMENCRAYSAPVHISMSTTSNDTLWESNCTGEVFLFNGKSCFTSGTYVDTLQNADGCDSIITLYLSVVSCEVLPPDNIIDTICYGTPPAFPWGIEPLWTSSVSGISPYISPLVGDLNNDGIPEIVCFGNANRYTIPNSNGATASRTMFVFNGAAPYNLISTNSLLESHAVAEHDAAPFVLFRRPTDGKGLIVIASIDYKLRAYEFNKGTSCPLLWTSNVDYGKNMGDFAVTLGVADFNADGYPEIYVRDKIYDASTGVLLATVPAGSNTGSSWAHESQNAVRWKLSAPFAADLLGDTKPELILGNEIYTVNITNHEATAGNSIVLARTIAPPAGVIADGHAQVADFNLDGYLDVLITNRKTYTNTGEVVAYVWDVFHNTIGNPLIINTTASGKSMPLIADVDHDEIPEMVIQCHASGANQNLHCYKYDTVTRTFQSPPLWSVFTNEDSYSTAPTLFDFNHDGIPEIVVIDKNNLHIINGSGKSHLTGADTIAAYTLTSIPCATQTVMQYPIVVDMNNDNHAEIVFIGADNQLHVYKSAAGTTWASARKVWNQYMYNALNINENLTVPATCFSPATVFPGKDGMDNTADDTRPFNNFLQQQTFLNEHGNPLWIYPPTVTQIFDTLCYGESLLFVDTNVSLAGTYYDTLKNIANCDSVLILHLTVNQPATHEFSDTSCISYSWNDVVYDTSGDKVQTFTATNGCDSIATLHLTINQPVTHEFSDTSCISYSWNGYLYYTGGDKVQPFIAANGCDSIVTLHLTIKQQVTHEFSDTSCASYSWNDVVYDTGGDKVQTFAAANGCDSIVTLHLTINQPVTHEFSDTSCSSYSWNDVVYDTGGDKVQIFTAANGCDSTVTLHLTIKQPVIHDFLISACNSYVWNDSTYYMGGDKVQTFTASNQCDSIVTLHLTLHHDTDTAFVDEHICLGDTFHFHGQMLSPVLPRTIYVEHLKTVHGCDSIVKLALWVHRQDTTMIDTMICKNQPLYFYDKIQPEHDTILSRVLHTYYGCDSTVIFYIHVPEVAVRIVTSNPDFCSTHTTTLTAITPNNTLFWSTGEQTTSIEITQGGIYSVTVEEEGCTLSDFITIEPCPEFIVFPNAITPGNNDGLNDWFYLPNTEDVQELNIHIYDRWGQLVFYSKDKNFQWDGRVKGKLIQTVFNYVALIVTKSGQELRFTGSVTVL